MALNSDKAGSSSPSEMVEDDEIENKDGFCEIRLVKDSPGGTSDMADRDGRKRARTEPVQDSTDFDGAFDDSDSELSDIDLDDVELDDLLELENDNAENDGDDLFSKLKATSFLNLTNKSSPSNTTPQLPPRIPIPSRPTSPDFEKVEAPIMINGVEVGLTEFGLTDGEIHLYYEILGKWRPRKPSRLRRCWMPI